MADPNAVQIALSALDAVQLVGMPESDVIIAQAAVYLARAPKSREVGQIISQRILKVERQTNFWNLFRISLGIYCIGSM